MIEPDHEKIAISRQCELSGLSRASYYYESQRDDSYTDADRRELRHFKKEEGVNGEQ